MICRNKFLLIYWIYFFVQLSLVYNIRVKNIKGENKLIQKRGTQYKESGASKSNFATTVLEEDVKTTKGKINEKFQKSLTTQFGQKGGIYFRSSLKNYPNRKTVKSISADILKTFAPESSADFIKHAPKLSTNTNDFQKKHSSENLYQSSNTSLNLKKSYENDGSNNFKTSSVKDLNKKNSIVSSNDDIYKEYQINKNSYDLKIGHSRGQFDEITLEEPYAIAVIRINSTDAKRRVIRDLIEIIRIITKLHLGDIRTRLKVRKNPHDTNEIFSDRNKGKGVKNEQNKEYPAEQKHQSKNEEYEEQSYTNSYRKNLPNKEFQFKDFHKDYLNTKSNLKNPYYHDEGRHNMSHVNDSNNEKYQGSQIKSSSQEHHDKESHEKMIYINTETNRLRKKIKTKVKLSHFMWNNLSNLHEISDVPVVVGKTEKLKETKDLETKKITNKAEENTKINNHDESLTVNHAFAVQDGNQAYEMLILDDAPYRETKENGDTKIPVRSSTKEYNKTTSRQKNKHFAISQNQRDDSSKETPFNRNNDQETKYFVTKNLDVDNNGAASFEVMDNNKLIRITELNNNINDNIELVIEGEEKKRNLKN